MKKIEYMAPEMEVVELKLHGMLCTSDTAGQGGEGGSDEELD